MAIEALKQLSDRERDINGFEIQDVTFHTAMAIPYSTKGVETEFYMRQVPNSSSKDLSWSSFRLFSYSDGQCIEHCNESARVEYVKESSEVDGGRELRELLRLFKQNHKLAAEQCESKVEAAELYDFLTSCGFGFGPSFQSVSNASYINTKALANIKCFQWDVLSEKNPRQIHVVHPCTLDGMIQLPMLALT